MWTLLQTTSTNDLFSLLQFGVLGIVLLALILGYLWTKPSVETLIDQLKATREELNNSRDHARALDEMRRHLASIDKRLEQLERSRER